MGLVQDRKRCYVEALAETVETVAKENVKSCGGKRMKLILAADENWAIGYKGGLLCHLSADLKYFKKMTSGHTVVMGRRTLESLPGGKGLPSRRNIVITSNEEFSAPGVDAVCHDMEELMRTLQEGKEADDTFVIGGANVYEQLLPLCDTCYITKIYKTFPADVHFVNLDDMEEFEIADESDLMEENGIKYRFLRYERKSRKKA